MRILIDPSSSHCLNLGDVAMMQVAVRRLTQFWPDATITVLTEAPELLQVYCPGTVPLRAVSRESFYRTAAIFQKLGQRLPTSLSPVMSELEAGWRQKYPAAAQKLVEARSRQAGLDHDADEYLRVLDACDFVVVSGAGQITTAFRETATLVLNTLEAAVIRGIPTAMFGQGIGPIDDANLLARARKVLPQVNLIALREAVVGPSLLGEMGVPKENVLATGDDAIESAYAERPSSLGNAVGVNLRVAQYSNIDASFIGELRQALTVAARELGVPLAAVPISHHPEERDQDFCNRLLEGHDAVLSPVNDTTTAEGVMREIGRCRVVVTTSYHAGVFALSQGVPVVGWIKSKYYAAKLMGLRNQFGVGCTVVSLEEPDAMEKLRTAIVSSWHSAETLRPQLLAAAEAQIAKGRAAYQRAFEMVCKLRPAAAYACN